MRFSKSLHFLSDVTDFEKIVDIFKFSRILGFLKDFYNSVRDFWLNSLPQLQFTVLRRRELNEERTFLQEFFAPCFPALFDLLISLGEEELIASVLKMGPLFQNGLY